MLKLYYLPGSLHSAKARELLKRTKLQHETINVSGKEMLMGIFVELGIRRVPVLEDDESRYEGLREIERFVEEICAEEPIAPSHTD